MKRKLVQSNPVLLTPSPIDMSIVSGGNYISDAFDNSDLGHTTAHIVLTVTELNGLTAGKMLYVYVLYETPNGWETGSVNTDPVKAAVGAIASYGSSYQHRISIPAPILRGQFKILLRNEWDGYRIQFVWPKLAYSFGAPRNGRRFVLRWECSLSFE